MTNIVYAQYRIYKTDYPLDGQYHYSAELDLNVNGSGFYHCGIGKYTKTLDDAIAWCKQYESEHPHDSEPWIYLRAGAGWYYPLMRANRINRLEIAAYRKEHGNKATHDLLLLGGPDFFDGTADEYDTMLKILEEEAQA